MHEYIPILISLVCGVALLSLISAMIFNSSFRDAMLGGSGDVKIAGIITAQGVAIVLLCALFLSGLIYPMSKIGWRDSKAPTTTEPHLDTEYISAAERRLSQMRQDIREKQKEISDLRRERADLEVLVPFVNELTNTINHYFYRRSELILNDRRNCFLYSYNRLYSDFKSVPVSTRVPPGQFQFVEGGSI